MRWMVCRDWPRLYENGERYPIEAFLRLLELPISQTVAYGMGNSSSSFDPSAGQIAEHGQLGQCGSTPDS